MLLFFLNFPTNMGMKRGVKLTVGKIRHAIYIVAYTANITNSLACWLADWLTKLTYWLTDW